MPTFLTVLKSGGRYTPAWVEALFAAARRHGPFDRLVVLSDVDVSLPGVERAALQHDWPHWWSKMEAFRPGLVRDTVVMCDLDTVVAGPLAPLAEPGLATMEDHFHSGRVSSALMRWEGDELADLYRTFATDPERWMAAGSCGDVPNAVHGDQVVIDHLLARSGRRPAFLQRAYPGLIKPYDAKHGIAAPVTFFIGDTKPVLGGDGQLHPPVVEAAE